jgi:hypothetical protein
MVSPVKNVWNLFQMPFPMHLQLSALFLAAPSVILTAGVGFPLNLVGPSHQPSGQPADLINGQRRSAISVDVYGTILASGFTPRYHCGVLSPGVLERNPCVAHVG